MLTKKLGPDSLESTKDQWLLHKQNKTKPRPVRIYGSWVAKYQQMFLIIWQFSENSEKMVNCKKTSHLKFVSINGLQENFEIWSCYLPPATTSHQLNQPLLCHFATTWDESQMCGTLLRKESCKEKSQPCSTTSDTIASIFQTSRKKGTFMETVQGGESINHRFIHQNWWSFVRGLSKLKSKPTLDPQNETLINKPKKYGSFSWTPPFQGAVVFQINFLKFGAGLFQSWHQQVGTQQNLRFHFLSESTESSDCERGSLGINFYLFLPTESQNSRFMKKLLCKE